MIKQFIMKVSVNEIMTGRLFTSNIPIIQSVIKMGHTNYNINVDYLVDESTQNTEQSDPTNIDNFKILFMNDYIVKSEQFNSPRSIQKELLHEALKSGKNIIFEINGENINVIKSLCSNDSDDDLGIRTLKFSDISRYDYEIILLIPYTHSWILLSTIDQDKSSIIYNTLNYIIENKCVDKLFLYDTNQKSKLDFLTNIFDNKQHNTVIRSLYNNRKFNILNSNKCIGIKSQSGGYPLKTNKLTEWIWSANKSAFRALSLIYEEKNLPGTLNNTFSYYNMSICNVYKNYYLSTIRVTGYPDGVTELPNGQTMMNKSEGIEYANQNYLSWIDKEPDSHPNYVNYAGDIFNKWYNPLGWWRSVVDKTLIILYKFDRNAFLIADSEITSSIVDARIFTTYEKIKKGEISKRHSIITGSLMNQIREDILFGVDKHTGECREITDREKIGWKQGMIHVFTEHNTGGDKPNIIANKTKKSAINPCLSEIEKTEKNYSMMYFEDEDEHRFNPDKGVLLHFHMTRSIGTTGGNIFYFKPIDFIKQSKETLFKNEGWIQYIPDRSDIFIRIQNYYASLTYGSEIDNFGRISCTSPLVNIDYGTVKGKLITGVAHLKINLYNYLETRIQFLSKQIFNSKERTQSQLEQDKIYRFYKYTMLLWLKQKVWGTQETIDKYTAYPFSKYGSNNYWETGSNELPRYLKPGYENVKELLLRDGFFRMEGQHKRIIRHLHPTYIYFMVIYRLNLTDLTLHSFSNPFIINKEDTASFLNFPNGITTNKDNIWISYGDGDCQSYLACLKKDRIDELCINNNHTDVSTIDFDLYYEPDKI